MVSNASAYAALGLEPGADWPTVEQAYKRLIKQHHPDRDGGDPIRAAEINRAYRELRIGRSSKEWLEIDHTSAEQQRDDRAWLVAGLIAIVVIGLFLLTQRPLVPLPQAHLGPGRADGIAADRMNQPLNLAAIDRAAQQALRLQRTQDEMALASESRDCHHRLRNAPSLLQLDRCAAFDDAVVQLQDRDPLRDQGPFSEIAVTGRIWSGATALSDDSVAIDGRLAKIRLRVERVLAPFVEPISSADTTSSI